MRFESDPATQQHSIIHLNKKELKLLEGIYMMSCYLHTAWPLYAMDAHELAKEYEKTHKGVSMSVIELEN